MPKLKKLGAIGLLRITPWEKVFGGLSTGKIPEHPAYIILKPWIRLFASAG